ncbi:MAG: MFS transporter [Chloroflexota bacterium]|nr:MFS transporter [Caldilinea sp.]GIK75136.1 MAG: MFS transporter [Chloroflexota bacterium]
MSESSRVFSATLLFFVAFYMLLVPLPPYLVDLGLADWQVGLVLGSFGIAALVGRPLAGLASDRLGRRTVILAGVVFFAVGVLAVLPTGDVLVLMAARTLQALGYVAVSTAATARISDLAPPARQGSTLARFGIAANVAMTLTPAAVDAALGRVTPVQVFYAAVLAALLCGALALSFGNRAAMSSFTTADNRLWVAPQSIRQPWLAAALLGVGFGVWLQFLPLLALRRGVEPVGLLYAVYGIAIILTRLATGPLQDRGRERLLLQAGFAAMAGGLGLFAFTATLPTFLMATSLVAAGGGILHPLLMALHVRFMPAAHRGRAVSTFYLGFDFGNGMGVWLLGFALQWWGLAALFGLAMVTSVVGLAVSTRCSSQQDSSAAVQS